MFISLLLFATHLALTKGLICWNCANESNNQACLSNGFPEICTPNQRSCQNEIRLGKFGARITKRCKQTGACRNNLLNLSVFLRQRNLRCSRQKTRLAVCRCCCTTNNCNRNEWGCQGFLTRTRPTLSPTTTSTTATHTSATSLSTLTDASTATSTTQQSTPTLPVIDTTINMSLSTATTMSTTTTQSTMSIMSPFIVTTISFPITLPQMERTLPFTGLTTVPRDPPDETERPTCNHPGIPLNGNIACFPEMLPSGRFEIETECEYECNNGLFVEGSISTTCLAIGDSNVARFSETPPLCRRCQALAPILNGNYNCSESLDTVCTATCNQGYSVSPNGIDSTTCLPDATWTHPLPCCLRNCPPDIFSDIIILLDISESVNEREWQLMQGFVAEFFGLFNIGRETTQFAIIRYNDVIDQEFQILLEDFSNDKDGLWKAFSEIPYEAQSHADTGLALEYALNVVLRSSNGDRRASNVVVVITDSEAFDDETVYESALSLQAEQIPTFVIGVVPELPDRLFLDQLSHLAGEEENLFLVQEGFEGLSDDQLLGSIIGRLCSIRSCDSERRRFDLQRNFPP